MEKRQLTVKVNCRFLYYKDLEKVISYSCGTACLNRITCAFPGNSNHSEKKNGKPKYIDKEALF